MIFRNRVAYVLWVFASLVVMFVAVMTWVGMTGDIASIESPVLLSVVLVLFWFGAIGLATFAVNTAVTIIEPAVGGGLRVTQRYPFRADIRYVGIDEIEEVVIVESVDDEGDPYFTATIQVRNEGGIHLAESHDRQRCEAARDRFLSAYG